MGDVINVTNGAQHPELSLRFAGATAAYLGSRPAPAIAAVPTPTPVAPNVSEQTPADAIVQPASVVQPVPLPETGRQSPARLEKPQREKEAPKGKERIEPSRFCTEIYFRIFSRKGAKERKGAKYLFE